MKIKDSIMGFVVGDALGVPYEFSSREEMKKDPATDMIGYGTYNMPPGTFSDDSSLVLATMNSIIHKNEIDYEDILAEFVKWYQDSKYTQYNNTFDIGTTTLESLNNYIKGENPLECGGREERDNGNGSLMRILPLAFVDDMDYETIENVSGLTHDHDRSKIACVFYVELVKAVANDKTISEAVNIASEKIKNHYNSNENLSYFNRITDGSICDLSSNDIKSSGYVIDTLESVVYILLNTYNFKDSILHAVDLGGDTDTIAAIVGGVSGLYYGYDSIPEDWISKIKCSERIIELCDKYEEVIR